MLALLDDAPLAIRTNTGGGYQIYGSGFFPEISAKWDSLWIRCVATLTWARGAEAEREQAKKMGQSARRGQTEGC